VHIGRIGLIAAFVATAAAPAGAGAISGSRAAATPACTTTFTAASGQWEQGANWDNGVPSSTSVACVPAPRVATLSSTVTVQAVVITGALNVDAPGALLLEAPRTVHSRIATLHIDQATLGGSGWVEATGSWTISSVATMTTRWPVPMPAAAPPDGGGVTEIDAGATVAVDANGGCSHGSQIRDGRTIQNDAGGTFVIRSCAYVAADWGTTFQNSGTVLLQSNLGFYEGYLGSDLGWPTTPPLFVNAGSVTMTASGAFVLAPRYTGSGTISVAKSSKVTIPDHLATATIGFAAAPSATASVGGSCSTQLCTPTVDSSDPVAATFANAAIAGAATHVALVQNPNDQTGKVFVKTARPGGQFWWPVTKGSFSYTQTNGRGTVNDPYVVTIVLDRTLLKGKAASEFGVGTRRSNTNVMLPTCAKGTPLPCIVSKRIAGGDLTVVLKTLQPKQLVGRFYPMGPRLYK
jgi:hypothetical protein